MGAIVTSLLTRLSIGAYIIPESATNRKLYEARLFPGVSPTSGAQRDIERAVTVSEWQPIEAAPVDEWVILATWGGHVGEAIYGEDEENPQWRWAPDPATVFLHPKLTPLKWMRLPSHPQQ